MNKWPLDDSRWVIVDAVPYVRWTAVGLPETSHGSLAFPVEPGPPTLHWAVWHGWLPRTTTGVPLGFTAPTTIIQSIQLAEFRVLVLSQEPKGAYAYEDMYDKAMFYTSEMAPR